jgi:hypothetical protein
MTSTRFGRPAGYHAQTAPFQVWQTLDVPAASCSLRLSFWVGRS